MAIEANADTNTKLWLVDTYGQIVFDSIATVNGSEASLSQHVTDSVALVEWFLRMALHFGIRFQHLG